MSSQTNQPDVNTLLHNMRAQILTLTTQLAEIQAKPPEAVEQKFNKKVKIVTDPGAFEGDQAQSAEWWIKENVFANDFEIATTVLSRLKGLVAGQYAQVRFQEYYTAGHWPTWDKLKQIRTFKQGNMRTDNFVTQFLSLSIQGGLGNEHAVELLERNMSPAIAQQLYIQDMRSKDLSAAAEEVQKIGRATSVSSGVWPQRDKY
ncbi:hypothetical protein SERLA73DRAFT_157414 [Serpula lacrymans var. lacrymans S7.3]|uniref:Retrotransposon gag domain-containing protein n=1 Tax=Serpula lacrymans var. lacrymans (strain S7.3) TaxID=936435 RepID=F8QIW8_SERL3|nr:hypothetical protein SERLA73DRAFT_157414 [Serpula lacrymans var. lacrymans S7.3]